MVEVAEQDKAKMHVIKEVRATEDHKKFYDRMFTTLLKCCRKHPSILMIDIVCIMARLTSNIITQLPPDEQIVATNLAIKNLSVRTPQGKSPTSFIIEESTSKES